MLSCKPQHTVVQSYFSEAGFLLIYHVRNISVTLIEFDLGVVVSLSLWWFMLELIKRDVVDMLSK